ISKTNEGGEATDIISGTTATLEDAENVTSDNATPEDVLIVKEEMDETPTPRDKSPHRELDYEVRPGIDYDAVTEVKAPKAIEVRKKRVLKKPEATVAIART